MGHLEDSVLLVLRGMAKSKVPNARDPSGRNPSRAPWSERGLVPFPFDPSISMIGMHLDGPSHHEAAVTRKGKYFTKNGDREDVESLDCQMDPRRKQDRSCIHRPERYRGEKTKTGDLVSAED